MEDGYHEILLVGESVVPHSLMNSPEAVFEMVEK